MEIHLIGKNEPLKVVIVIEKQYISRKRGK